MLIIGIAGTELADNEREWLQHEACGGVILFARNFASRDQVIALTRSIREAARNPQLICVDQEGGRVQRFREGFSALPPLEVFASRDDLDSAREHAWLMASEIRALGMDLSFAPVLDLGRGNLAIGNRAFSPHPETVARYGVSYIAGLHDAGMGATIKHFPGHGSVLADTHFDTAIDPRSLTEIRELDLVPFVAAINEGADAVMMAHVIYPQVSEDPAGYSKVWIQEILRGELGFKGVIFSDDIGMAAANSVGGVGSRIHAHLDAGCDVVLVCHPELVEESLEAMQGRAMQKNVLASLIKDGQESWEALSGSDRYVQTRRNVEALA